MISPMINASLQVLRTASIALLLGIGLVLSAQGQVPSVIQYQGTLADEGAPVTETLSMTFTIAAPTPWRGGAGPASARPGRTWRT